VPSRRGERPVLSDEGEVTERLQHSASLAPT
jgi:hypothetical protein